jgi:hypothetical protein
MAFDRTKIESNEPLPELPKIPKKLAYERHKRNLKKTVRESFEFLLSESASVVQGKNYEFDELAVIFLELYPHLDMKEVVALAMTHKALKGDVHAAVFIRDTLGEAPKMQVTDGDKEFTLNIQVQE